MTESVNRSQIDTNVLKSRRRQVVCGSVLSLGLILTYAPNLKDLVRTWWQEPDYSHGFLVPVVALLIVRKRLDWGHPSWIGMGLLGAVLAARAFCFQRGDFWLETATIVPALAALALGMGGWPLIRRAWPAIAFLVFMLPIPPRVHAKLSLPLQRVASAASGEALRLSGLWVVDDGNILDIGEDRLEVATACNGLAMLMSLSATVATIICLLPMSREKRVVLLLSTVPLGLLCNILRIVATAYCYEYFGSAAGREFSHDLAGWLMMPLAIVIIGLEMAWFSWVFPRRRAPDYSSPALSATNPSIALTR